MSDAGMGGGATGGGAAGGGAAGGGAAGGGAAGGGALEACDGIDNDNDTIIDEGNPDGGVSCTTGKPGACAAGMTQCLLGMLECVETTPASPEVCDAVDNDCDGTIDDGNPGGGGSCITALPGVCSDGVRQCVGGAFACQQLTQPSSEVCDGRDNDCDGTVDEPDSNGCTTYYRDVDMDNFGVSSDKRCLCGPSGVYRSTQVGDCNDNAPEMHPGAPEICGDQADQDCDGFVDNGCP